MKETIDLSQHTRETDDNFVDSIPESLISSPDESAAEKEPSLEMIQRGIKGGLSILEKQIDIWSEAAQDNNLQADELTLKSLKGVKNTLNNLNYLVELIQNDTVNVIKNIESQAMSQWTIQAHLQTLIETLKKNNLIKETELEETWNELISETDEVN